MDKRKDDFSLWIFTMRLAQVEQDELQDVHEYSNKDHERYAVWNANYLTLVVYRVQQQMTIDYIQRHVRVPEVFHHAQPMALALRLLATNVPKLLISWRFFSALFVGVATVGAKTAFTFFSQTAYSEP
uniref:Uncharacterized protein n=1 Tax=Anopheles culicifacies TaxID=139723 RepID=A0A182ME24_9DIPT